MTHFKSLFEEYTRWKTTLRQLEVNSLLEIFNSQAPEWAETRSDKRGKIVSEMVATNKNAKNPHLEEDV